MKYEISDHCNGLNIVPEIIILELAKILDECKVSFFNGQIPEVRKVVYESLLMQGWSPEVKLDSSSSITITSVKKGIGLCLQTGNMSRVYADLLKLQTAFVKHIISCGILILPTNDGAKRLGYNVANQKRVSRELSIFINVINIPLVLFGIQE